MRTARKGSVEMPAFMRQLVKETEKRVSSFFKGGRGGAAEGEQPGVEEEKEEVIPSPYLDRPVLDKLTEEGCCPLGAHLRPGKHAGLEGQHGGLPQLCATAGWRAGLTGASLPCSTVMQAARWHSTALSIFWVTSWPQVDWNQWTILKG
ncbi:hypothetical protein E3U43_023026 [Larimichthys crocea]|uniref:Uncharacterized protein n=1 Tax=Larimichthys crocea TaxID=215358 RepID=A0ACD3R4Z2_LARCR|nr:hypothetical protein E3U43_023026 [Larimichthys crocea]